jgi:hypothetical protein
MFSSEKVKFGGSEIHEQQKEMNSEQRIENAKKGHVEITVKHRWTYVILWNPNRKVKEKTKT